MRVVSDQVAIDTLLFSLDTAMAHVSEGELNIMLSYVRDFDVIRMDRDLPELKERSEVMKNRLDKALENIYGPFRFPG